MKRPVWKVALGMLALVALASAVPVAAAEEVPFSADLIAVFIEFDREAALYALEGNATQMGPVTGVARNQVKGPFQEEGVLFLEVANGDALFFAYQLERQLGHAQGIYVVIGGTGRFEGAGGSGVAVVDASQGDITVTLDGVLSF